MSKIKSHVRDVKKFVCETLCKTLDKMIEFATFAIGFVAIITFLLERLTGIF